jgi:ribosomal protein S21
LAVVRDIATQAKKDSFMVEVEVGEDEAEDLAVRRFMKRVVESKVIEQLRARRTRETKIEAYKRRFRERCEARKLERELGISEQSWNEIYGLDHEAQPSKPFHDFFSGYDPDDPDAYLDAQNSLGNGLGEEFFNQVCCLCACIVSLKLAWPPSAWGWGGVHVRVCERLRVCVFVSAGRGE